MQRGSDPEARFFQGFMEEGHYGGRTKPTKTRQGIYAVAPSGQFLSSINTRKAATMVQMLETALAAWKELDKRQRLGAALKLPNASRFERHYPEDGLILRCTSRDLVEEDTLEEGDWRRQAWNQDFAWFRKEEVASMIPKAEVGATKSWSPHLAQRLAECHLLDTVRGQTPPFGKNEVEHAEISCEVTRIVDGALHLRIIGRTKAQRIKGTGDAQWNNGLECVLLGRAVFTVDRFSSFELVALGRRWGRTKYNAREEESQSQMGIVMALEAEAPRVAPANHWRYGWH